MEKNDLAFVPPEAQQSFLRRHRTALLLLLGILVFIVLLTRFVHFRQQQHQEQASTARQNRFRGHPGGGAGENAPVAVSVATVSTGDILVRIPALGTITPLSTVTVKTQISGQLEKIYFTEGQLVKQ